MKKILLSLVALLMAGGAWAQINTEAIESGFYRIKHVASNRYLYAPATLPTGSTSNQVYKATFSAAGAEVDATDAHRDVWYIENLGTNDAVEGNKDKIIYKLWCFQGGYGLATNPSPDVYGSFDKNYCPRLYSVVKTAEGKYTIAGHPYDNNNIGSNINVLGLASNSGSIGNHTPLKPTDNEYASLARGGNAANEETHWEIYPVNESDISKTVTIGETGVATFAYTSDTEIPEGVEAYVATAVGENITLKKIEGTIPARQGVVLRKTDATQTDFTFKAVHGLGIGMSKVNQDGTLTQVSDNGNLLVGTLSEEALAVGDYILTKKKVDGVAIDEVVFGKISAVSNISANKAYLPAENGSEVRGFYSMLWDDMETFIEQIQSEEIKQNGMFIEGSQVVIFKEGVKFNLKGQRVK